MKDRPQRETRNEKRNGFTLLELLIAITLFSIIAVVIVVSLRVGLSAMNKVDERLMSNRRVAGVERVLEQQIAGLMPVTADCQNAGDGPPGHAMFFQGEPQSMRLTSSYSLQEGSRGLPMILEYMVIPGENAEGVRLIVNEHLYSGPRSAGQFCAAGGPLPTFLPIQTGPASFVLADKLAYCRFSFRELRPPPESARWVPIWTQQRLLPNAIRIEMAPLKPNAAKLEPVTLTMPIHVTRLPLEDYAF
ncbi:MAG TPA: prepilin-type N-terminal cleavage/methylation domain-containing protein [Bryobacteraceae bacterium]|nr:prepilin-type N-terminal cleavage/methylation domain-containing protein [Bryobacteraceae bacterium]